MSVMACIRNKCENIMCDQYIEDHGYICNDCCKELKEFYAPPRLEKILEDFMNTPKPKQTFLTIDITER